MVEEAHYWRSSVEHRARHYQNWKSGQFSYFDQQLNHPDWSGKRVLDFGGNAGNLLRNPDCTIRQEDYYCLEVLREALEAGQKRFPGANWVHYDRFNCSFNPEGDPSALIPDFGVTFDIILAYSVFTHTTREEMHDLVNQLRGRLAPGGLLAFTFIDHHWKSWPESYDGNNLKWRLERNREADIFVDIDRFLEQSRHANWCALVNGDELYVDSNGAREDTPHPCLTYNVFYTAEFLQREFPESEIRPPVNGEMQHCCIMQSDR
jgi:SAM-dependent methyltransferase